MWYDLTTTDIPDAVLTDEEKTPKGFRMFLMAHYFLWTYPKNAELLASRFGTNEQYARGKRLWNWIKKIAAMKAKKIVWNVDSLAEIFVISVDGKDFKCWEPKHAQLPVDPGMKSDKFNKSGWKYEIALSMVEPKVVWISGPHRGGKHDLSIFREGLKQKMLELPGKLVNADLGYRTSEWDEVGMMAYPNSMDPEQLMEFKSRGRCRQETFNGRLVHFKICQDTFRHTKEQHKHAFEAVVVTVQYQMDNGSPIYSV